MKKDMKEKTIIGDDGEIITVRETVKEKKYTQEQYNKLHAPKNSNGLNVKLIVILVLVLIVAIIGVLSLQTFMKDDFNQKIRATVQKGTVYGTIDGSSVIVSSLSEAITSKVSSTVTKVYYKQNQTVRSGALLLELDNTFAKDEIARYNTSLNGMQNMLKLYDKKVEELTVNAPTDGFIVNVKVKKGDSVKEGDLLASYIPTTCFSSIYSFVYDENRKIEQWQKVIVSYEGGTVNGIVYNITGDSSQGKTIQVEVYITNSQVNLSGLVTTAEVETLNGKVNSTVSSNIRIVPTIPLYATQTGKVETININNSKAVNAGTVLVSLSNADIQALKIKYTNDVATLQNTVNYKNNYDLNNYLIYAQIGGVVQTPELSVGDLVVANKEIILIQTEQDIKTTIYVGSAYIDNIALGQSAKLYVDIDGNTITLNGTVTNKESRLLLQEGVDYAVEITVKSSEAKPEYIGRTVNVGIVTQEKKNSLFVPTSLVYGNTVYVPINGEAVPKTVTIGIKNLQYTEILEGLAEGDVIMEQN